MTFDIYSGTRSGNLPDFQEFDSLQHPELYRPSPALENAVNVSLNLGKPLLLTGEPGTGKTQLAWSIAFRLGLGEPLVFNTRTSSTATDLFYRYNAIGHFQHVQGSGKSALTADEVENQFIRYQALGEAIRSKSRRVVLIDEIDKAPRDLPNDILNVLEDMAFDVPEIGKRYASESRLRPVLVMTSNSEKNLPDAFLRRCVYFHIPFPGAAELESILTAKIRDMQYTPQVIGQVVVPHFLMIREKLQRKKPGTAELLHWLAVLVKMRVDPELVRGFSYVPAEKRTPLLASYHVLAKNEADLAILRNMLGFVL